MSLWQIVAIVAVTLVAMEFYAWATVSYTHLTLPTILLV